MGLNHNLKGVIVTPHIAQLSATLKRGISGGVIITAVSAMIAIAIEIFLARIMGVKQYGVYVYTVTLVSLLVILARMGFDLALLRYIPAYTACEEWSLLKGVLVRSLQIVLTSGLIIALVGVVIVLALRQYIEYQLMVALLIAMALVPIIPVIHLTQASIRAWRHVVISQVPFQVMTPVLIMLVLGILAYGIGRSIQASEAIIVNVIASAASLFAARFLLRGYQPKQLGSCTPIHRTREWVYAALPLLFVTGTILILNQTDTFMLGLLLGTDAAGIYNAASRMSLVSAFPLAAVNTIVAPMISELHALGRHKDLQRMLRSVAIGVSIATAIIGTIIIISGEWALSWFGIDFRSAYSSLCILTGGQMINGLSGPVGYLLMQTGHQSQAAIILVVGAALNIVLNIFLIPFLGLAGAALATAIALSAWNITMVVYAYRQLGLNATVFSRTIK